MHNNNSGITVILWFINVKYVPIRTRYKPGFPKLWSTADSTDFQSISFFLFLAEFKIIDSFFFYNEHMLKYSDRLLVESDLRI